MTEKRFGKDNILTVCKKLEKMGFISDFVEHKYTIQILINWDSEYEEESYQIRNRIIGNFEKQGYKVEIKGTWWLNIIFVDAIKRVDDCFMED